MDITATRNVNEIPADERRTLEHLLGSTLEPDQHVLILTYKPSALPEDESRRAARERILQSLTINGEFAISQGFTASEADAAIDEAMHMFRSKSLGSNRT